MVARVAVLVSPHHLSLSGVRAWIADRTWPLLVLAATMVGAVLRLSSLGTRSLWYDELISALIARESLSDILRARLHLGASPELVDRLYTNNPPLHLVLLHAVGWVSHDDAVSRLPFALAGIAAIPVSYLVLKRLFDPTVATAAAALLAISPIHIAYSQEARPTSLLILFALGMLLFLLRATEGNRSRDWIGMAVCGVLAVWTSYFALTLVLPALGFIWIMQLMRDAWGTPWRSWVSRILPAALAFGTIGLFALPLVPDLRHIAHLNEVESPGSPNVLGSAARFHLTHFMLVAPIPVTSHSLTSVLSQSFAVAGLLQLAIRRRFGYRMAFVWIVVPFVVLLTIKSSHPIEPRYVMFVLPMALANIVVGIRFFTKPLLRLANGRIARWLGIGLFAATAIGYGAGVRAYQDHFTPAAPSKLDWRSAAHFYADHAASESCLVVVDHVSWAVVKPLRYYLGEDDAAPCTIDARDPRLLTVAGAHPDLWWAVEVDFDDDEDVRNLRAALAKSHDITSFLGVVVLHPRNVAPDTARYLEDTIGQLVTTLEPHGDDNGTMLGSRTALANLYALTGRVEQAARVLTDVKPFLLVRSIPSWWSDVETSLRRGDVDTARSQALWLVTIHPGDPEAYDRLADVERQAGSGRPAAYESLAAALRRSRR